MTLNDYLIQSGSKYAVIRAESYRSDPVAQALSPAPRHFTFNGVEMVILSLDPARVAELAEYAQQAGNGVEFELTINTGKVTLLTHSQAEILLTENDNELPDL